MSAFVDRIPEKKDGEEQETITRRQAKGVTLYARVRLVNKNFLEENAKVRSMSVAMFLDILLDMLREDYDYDGYAPKPKRGHRKAR